MKEAFEKIKERLEEESHYSCFHCMDRALSIVSEVEAEFGKDINVRSNGWIPCSERLPENDDDVLVWYRYRMMQGVNIVGSKEMYGIGHYYKPTDSWLIYGGFGLDQNVVAWQPLPEPPKKEGN